MVSKLKPIASVGADFDGFLRYIYPSPYRLFELFRKTPTLQQRAVLDNIEREYQKPVHLRRKRKAMKSGQGTGKTSLLGALDSWATLRMRNGLAVHTAPTAAQCRDAFLADLRINVANGDPILSQVFRILEDKVQFFGEKEWAIKTRTSTKDVNLQGYHRDNLTVSVDEGSGVSRGIYEQFQGTISNSDSLFIVAGNPNLRECYFYDIFYGEHRHQWDRWTFNAEKSEIVSQHNIERIAAEYGKDSNVYRVRVLGEFPRGNPDQIIDPESLQLAMQRFGHVQLAHLTPLSYSSYPVQFGMDFAWMGDHESVVACRTNRIVRIRCFNKIHPEKLIDEALKWQKEIGAQDSQTLFCGDCGGIGGPAMGKLSDMPNKNVLKFHNNGVPRNSREYDNAITEAWFVLRKMLEREEITLQDDNRLRDQLLSRTYEISDTTQLIRVTPKGKHLSSDIGPSPDRAEAVIYSCFNKGTSSIAMLNVKRSA